MRRLLTCWSVFNLAQLVYYAYVNMLRRTILFAALLAGAASFDASDVAGASRAASVRPACAGRPEAGPRLLYGNPRGLRRAPLRQRGAASLHGPLLPRSPALTSAAGAQAERELLACPATSGCLRPRYLPGHYNATTHMHVVFSSPYSSFASQSGAQMAYGICLAVNCNYRHVAVSYATGDMTAKTEFVYSVTFWDETQEAASAWADAWTALLPLSDTGSYDAPTELYGFNSGAGGALANIELIEDGWGGFTDPSVRT